jgi:hypothetical protein
MRGTINIHTNTNTYAGSEPHTNPISYTTA